MGTKTVHFRYILLHSKGVMDGMVDSIKEPDQLNILTFLFLLYGYIVLDVHIS